ncbi:MAG: cardiolipin hydrolase [Planctomycetota bacterium]|jgi:cardiolipin hydrolase
MALAGHVTEDKSKGELAQACFSPGEDCLRLITRQLDQTRVQADISVFTITDDRITRAIERAADQGVRLRLLSDNDKAFDLGSDIDRLSGHGIPVAVDTPPSHMHHKFATFDGQKLLTGSYNWTRSAADRNEENLILSDDQRFVSAFQEVFDKLWESYFRGKQQ